MIARVDDGKDRNLCIKKLFLVKGPKLSINRTRTRRIDKRPGQRPQE